VPYYPYSNCTKVRNQANRDQKPVKKSTKLSKPRKLYKKIENFSQKYYKEGI